MGLWVQQEMSRAGKGILNRVAKSQEDARTCRVLGTGYSVLILDKDNVVVPRLVTSLLPRQP